MNKTPPSMDGIDGLYKNILGFVNMSQQIELHYEN